MVKIALFVVYNNEKQMILSSQIFPTTREIMDLDRVQDVFRQVSQVASPFMPKRKS